MFLSKSNRKTFSLSLNLSFSKSSNNPPRPTAADPTPPPLPPKAHPSPLPEGFASPRSPLLPASPPPKQDQPLLAIPLTDGLDPTEKMKLLRKSRKISRILGEVPIPVPVDDLAYAYATDLRPGAFLDEPPTSASTSACSSPMKSPPGIDRIGSLRRSATVAHNRLAQQSEIHRARSLASLRPSLSIPRSPFATFSARDDLALRERLPPLPPPLPPSPISPVTPSADSPTRFGFSSSSRRDSTASSSSRRNSMSSLGPLPSERTPEQVQRARAAKLTRQLGENVPPDVLLRAASPLPRARAPLTSPSAVSLAATSLELRSEHALPAPPTPDEQQQQQPAPPANAKRPHRDRRPKRRLSWDVAARRDAAAFLSAEAPRARGLLKRASTSRRNALRPQTAGAVETLRRMPKQLEDSDAEMDADDYDEELWSPAEKQRALNVRRARKMAQVRAGGGSIHPSLLPRWLCGC